MAKTTAEVAQEATDRELRTVVVKALKFHSETEVRRLIERTLNDARR